jgi:hypothetical protein
MGKQENLAALGKFAEAANTGKFDFVPGGGGGGLRGS